MLMNSERDVNVASVAARIQYIGCHDITTTFDTWMT